MILSLALAAAAVTARHDIVILSSVETSDFVKQCEGAPTDLSGNFCVGYIMGAYDELALTRLICAPGSGATTLAAVAATRKYLSDHPEQWSQHTSAIVRRALQATFPCHR